MAIPRQKKLLLPIFFLSGFAALVYEVIWARMLSIVFGSTVEAVSAVVAAFMAGLALGSYLMGRWADRRDDILFIYSLAEIGIGTSSLFLYYLIIYLPDILTNTKTEFIPSQSYGLYILEFSLVFIPTTLMGATFPLMVRSYVSSRNYVGEGISLIYTVNTLGAVFGAFCTGFFLIPFLGMRMTAATAVTINILLALTLYIINLFHLEKSVPLVPYDNRGEYYPKAALPISSPSSLVALSVLLVLTLSGFASLAYQVAWTRVLTMVIGNTVYAFTTILTTFLAGIAIGSFLFIKWIDRIKDKFLFLGVVQLLLCISVVGMIPMMDSLPLLFLKLFRVLPENFVGTVLIEFFVAFTVILVPTILMGAAFPIAAKAYLCMVDNMGEGLGRLYAVNTIGAIFGSFLTGFIFIPVAGVQKTILLISALNLLSCIILILQAETVNKTWKGAIPVISILFFIYFAATVHTWNKNILNRGVYLYAEWLNKLPEMGINLSKFSDEFKLLYYEEGRSGTVAVTKTDVISLQINGKTDAGTSSDDMTTQTMLSVLPLLLHPDPKDIAIIGLGSGISLGTAERFPVETIDCLEIIPEVVKANRYFSAFNHNALNDRRANLIVADGRQYLSATRKMYDVIISEPSNPWITGVSNLFTLEFFEIAEKRLRKDGLMCQWFHLYSMNSSEVKTLLNTFRSAFPHVSIWSFTPTDLIILGSRNAVRFDDDRLYAAFSNPEIREELLRAGIKEEKQLKSAYLMGNEEVRRFSRGTGLNTDDKPVVEFEAPKALYHPTVKQNISSILSVRRLKNP